MLNGRRGESRMKRAEFAGEDANHRARQADGHPDVHWYSPLRIGTREKTSGGPPKQRSEALRVIFRPQLPLALLVPKSSPIAQKDGVLACRIALRAARTSKAGWTRCFLISVAS